MTRRFGRLPGLSAALLSLVCAGAARAQSPANLGRQLERQAVSNVGNAVVGQPAAAVPGQPAPGLPGQPAVALPGQPAPGLPGQPASGLPVTPGRALQGMERQAVNSATSALTGQPAGASAAAASAARYQLPSQYAASAPGTTVSYGGANYVVNADRTMSPLASPALPAAGLPGQPAGAGLPASPGQALRGMGRQAINNATGALTGQPAAAASTARYQLPPQYAASAPGTTLSYGGANYVVNADRTMSPTAAAAQPAASAVRYQVPAQFATSVPGTTVSYGGSNYVINNDRTMSPAAR